MTLERDLLAGSRIIGGFSALARRFRAAGEKLARRLLQDPASLRLRAAWEAIPIRVLGVLTAAFAAANWSVLQLLGKQLPREGMMLRVTLLVLGIAGIACGNPRRKTADPK